jgi:hypothetical protein
MKVICSYAKVPVALGGWGLRGYRGSIQGLHAAYIGLCQGGYCGHVSLVGR